MLHEMWKRSPSFELLHFASFPRHDPGGEEPANFSDTLAKCSLIINSIVPYLDTGVWDTPLKDSKWKSHPSFHLTKLGADRLPYVWGSSNFKELSFLKSSYTCSWHFSLDTLMLILWLPFALAKRNLQSTWIKAIGCESCWVGTKKRSYNAKLLWKLSPIQ